MDIRRLNQSGISVFQAFLDSHTGEEPLPYPEAILEDAAHTESIDTAATIEHRKFETRFELASYLHSCFESAGFRPDRSDPGFWAWIACFYFREICPAARGKLQPGASPRWIPQSGDFRRYYRHLIAGPYGIYHAHRDDPQRAMALLCQRPGRPGDLVEQMASRQQVVTNPTIMQVATICYVDPKTGKQLPSANRKGAGGARRFIDVLGQFDVTWDLSMMTPADLHAHMGDEFRINQSPPT
jgi:hypothetical protein